MKPTELLARAPTGDGDEMTLTRRDGAYYLNLKSSGELMTSRAHGSERALATLACKAMPKSARPRVLVGGLGFGYTLRAALDALPPEAEVVVAELFELVLTANRGEVGELAGRPLDDPRVSVRMGDVRDALGDATFDAILLDVDNGPEAFTLVANSRLYSAKGSGADRAQSRAARHPGHLVERRRPALRAGAAALRRLRFLHPLGRAHPLARRRPRRPPHHRPRAAPAGGALRGRVGLGQAETAAASGNSGWTSSRATVTSFDTPRSSMVTP